MIHTDVTPSRGRHARPGLIGGWLTGRAEKRVRRHEEKADAAYVATLRADIEAKGARIAELEKALQVADDANEHTRRPISVPSWARDTSQTEDQPTDAQKPPREMSDDYLDRMRLSWRGPIAGVPDVPQECATHRPPTSPTDIPVHLATIPAAS